MTKEGFLDLDTDSLKSCTASQMSGTTSRRRAKEIEAKRKTKVIGGHGMAIRDDKRGSQKLHKLYDNDITKKEFGKDDN